MKYRYTLEILAYDGRIIHLTIEAENLQIEVGVIKFVSDGGDLWIPIAIYPTDKTIFTTRENL